MHFVSNLRHLWRHAAFRRLLGIRVFTQSADGTLQVGMASYVLFSPQHQTSAWAIAWVLTITLLPFSLLGPFVSVYLDRWSRRQTAVVVEFSRAVMAIAISVLVWQGTSGQWASVMFYALLLVALSLNRFLLAGLSAALQHTVRREEYLTASALMPMIGPAGVLFGGLLGGIVRLTVSGWMPAYRADALVFGLASLMWIAAGVLALGFDRWALGPDQIRTVSSVGHIWRELGFAAAHIRQRRPALLALATIGVQRILFGLLSVAVILIFRNHLHSQAEANAALLDVGIWAASAGAGFVASVVLVPPLAHRIGVRRTIVVLLAATGVVQLMPGTLLERWPLVISAFFIGWFAQSVKIAVDTVVQAHVEEHLKGRVFVIYDAIFNIALVSAGVIGALILPADGAAVWVFVAMGVGYLVLAVLFQRLSRELGDDTFNEGTDLHMATPAV